MLQPRGHERLTHEAFGRHHIRAVMELFDRDLASQSLVEHRDDSPDPAGRDGPTTLVAISDHHGELLPRRRAGVWQCRFRVALGDRRERFVAVARVVHRRPDHTLADLGCRVGP